MAPTTRSALVLYLLLLVAAISSVALGSSTGPTKTLPPDERDIAELQVLTKDDDPGRLHLHVQAFNESHDVQLSPAGPVFAPDLAQFFSDADGQILQAQDRHRTHEEIQRNLWTDDTGSTSVHVDRKNGKVLVEGLLNGNIRLLPMFHPDTDPIHVAFRTSSEDNATQTCTAIEPGVTRAATPELKERAALPSTVYPELLLVLDYKSSAYFNFDIDAVKKYLAIFYGSVNTRYNSISYPKIQTLISGIVVTTTPRGEPYVVPGAGPGTAKDAETLDAFGRWVDANSYRLTMKKDIAYWLTGLDLGSFSDSGWDNSVTGISYIGGACLSFRGKSIYVGIGEDTPGMFRGVHTATHEEGHLLGAAHDGDSSNNPPGNPGAQSCPWSDGYIMSYVFGTKNKFYFSSCSAREFAFLLSSSQGSCLLDTPTASKVTFSSVYPGEVITLDQQCQTTAGSGSRFVSQKVDSVCVQMWCYQPGQFNSFSVPITTSGPAYEGSPCGTGKWCIKGECVSKN